jgi:hypothetical protein
MPTKLEETAFPANKASPHYDDDWNSQYHCELATQWPRCHLNARRGKGNNEDRQACVRAHMSRKRRAWCTIETVSKCTCARIAFAIDGWVVDEACPPCFDSGDGRLLEVSPSRVLSHLPIRVYSDSTMPHGTSLTTAVSFDDEARRVHGELEGLPKRTRQAPSHPRP